MLGDADQPGLVEVPPVRFRVTQRGSGPPLVLVHGLSGSSRWWTRNVQALAQRHTVVAIDLVGFGSNRRWRGSELPLPFDDAASVLGRWLTESFPDGVHLLGHSMGGQISILVAAAYPKAVRSLILVGSTGAGFEIDLRGHLRNALATSRETLRFGPTVARDFLRAGPTAVALAAARILRSDAREAMEALALPTLLIWGEHDPLVPERYGHAMLESIVGSRMTVVSRAGHLPMWENAEEFNAAVLDFVAEVEASEQVLGREPRGHAFQWGIDEVYDGICWRASGARADAMLVHGLGITSAYFQPLARELHRRGIDSIAVDQPGTGWSSGDASSIEAAVDAVIRIADRLERAPQLWIGHSTGCQLVERVVAKRPDLVRQAIHMSPIWSDRRDLAQRLIAAAIGDAMRESPELVLFAVVTYVRSGLWPLGRAMWRYVQDAKRTQSLRDTDFVITGEEDPLADIDRLREITSDRLLLVPGAHAMHFRYPAATADAIVASWTKC